MKKRKRCRHWWVKEFQPHYQGKVERLHYLWCKECEKVQVVGWEWEQSTEGYVGSAWGRWYRIRRVPTGTRWSCEELQGDFYDEFRAARFATATSLAEAKEKCYRKAAQRQNG